MLWCKQFFSARNATYESDEDSHVHDITFMVLFFFSCIITHGRVDVWNDKELWLATTDQNKKTTKKQNKQHPPNKPNTFWSHQWQKVNKLSIWFISWISMSSPSEYLVLLVRGSYGQKDWNNRKKLEYLETQKHNISSALNQSNVSDQEAEAHKLKRIFTGSGVSVLTAQWIDDFSCQY